MQLSIHGQAMMDGTDVVVADIGDAKRMSEACAQREPELVFHTAALSSYVRGPVLDARDLHSVQSPLVGSHVFARVATMSLDPTG